VERIIITDVLLTQLKGEMTFTWTRLTTTIMINNLSTTVVNNKSIVRIAYLLVLIMIYVRYSSSILQVLLTKLPRCLKVAIDEAEFRGII
jgi:hypothetical protein